MKLLTAITSLKLLGPGYKYATRLLSVSELFPDIPGQGLLVVGSGDPTFGSSMMTNHQHSPFVEWVSSLIDEKSRNQYKFIVGDDSAFDKQLYNKGWEIEDIESKIAPAIGGLQYRDNEITVAIQPATRIGRKPYLQKEPLLHSFRLTNRITTADRGANSSVTVRKALGFDRAILEGSIAADSKGIELGVPISSPSRFFLNCFRLKLREEHLVQQSILRVVHKNVVQEKSRIIEVHYSESLDRIIRLMLKTSNNFYADTLLKTLGRECEGEGSTLGGIKVIRRFLQDIQDKPLPHFIADGSGLSRLNLLAPRTMVDVLIAAYQDTGMALVTMKDYLSIAGIDGTLAGRFKETRLAGKLYGKTGSMRGVRALSGYIYSGSRPIVFSIITNHFTTTARSIEKAQEEVCLILSQGDE